MLFNKNKKNYLNMKEFYYKGLKYPRSSVSDLMKFASKYSLINDVISFGVWSYSPNAFGSPAFGNADV